MTIKRKLFTLVFGEMMMFLLITAIAIISYLPILRLNDEFSEFSKLADQALMAELHVNKLMNSPLELQWIAAEEEHDRLVAQFNTVSELKDIRDVNERVSKAMNMVLLLEELYTDRWNSLAELMPDILDDAEQTMFSRTVPLINFYKMKRTSRAIDYVAVMNRVYELERWIGITEGALSSAFEVITTEYESIKNELAKQTRQLLVRAGIMFVLGLAVIFVVSAIVASRIAGSVVTLEKGVSFLREGRLNADFNSTSKDEVGRLGLNLNGFVEGLSASIRKIKESSANTLQMKNELTCAAEDSRTSAEGISEAVFSIRTGMVDLDSRVSESGVAVNTVKDRTEQLEQMLNEQMAMIEESTSSVTEMIASIGNVNEITGKKKEATGELVRTAEYGGEKLQQTISVIQEITDNIDDIRSTASVIQSVAAQTSLLAMNAAIEAAHAGGAGAGFSVVAEEIRKLAEASGTSSKRISGVIKDVVGRIEQAAASGSDTKRAFEDINNDIAGVTGALEEINLSMHELAAGGEQILDAMTSLRGYAVRVRDGGSATSDASANLEEAFLLVERVTGSVLSRVGDISSRIDEIKEYSGVVSVISQRLSVEAERLEAEVSNYTLDGDAGS